MDRPALIATLEELANRYDAEGRFAEADIVDGVMRSLVKTAQNRSDYIVNDPSWDSSWRQHAYLKEAEKLRVSDPKVADFVTDAIRDAIHNGSTLVEVVNRLQKDERYNHARFLEPLVNLGELAGIPRDDKARNALSPQTEVDAKRLRITQEGELRNVPFTAQTPAEAPTAAGAQPEPQTPAEAPPAAGAQPKPQTPAEAPPAATEAPPAAIDPELAARQRAWAFLKQQGSSRGPIRGYLEWGLDGNKSKDEVIQRAKADGRPAEFINTLDQYLTYLMPEGAAQLFRPNDNYNERNYAAPAEFDTKTDRRVPPAGTARTPGHGAGTAKTPGQGTDTPPASLYKKLTGKDPLDQFAGM
jgi:hypothetical protein